MEKLSPVFPVRPVAGYIGGKRGLAKRLCERIAQIPHDTYAEPFVGMGGIFLRRDMKPRQEVINDYSQDVATFFRVLRHHHQAFVDMLRFQVTARAEFERLSATNPDTLTDLQRSARFLYLQKLAFGGKVSGRNYGVSVGRGAPFDVTKLVPMLADLHERLAGVEIERLDWSAFIKRYDRPATLFYLDPPYYGCEGDYGKDLFGRDQFEAIAEQLASLRGQFLLSLNDCTDVRRIFARFTIEAVKVRYSVGGPKHSHMAGEVIISN